MAVVNSDKEAETLRDLYFNYGPARVQRGKRDYANNINDFDEPRDDTSTDYPADPSTDYPADPSTDYPADPSTDYPTETALTQETSTPEPANAIVHIGFHDIFIEGEYLTVRSKYYPVHTVFTESHGAQTFDVEVGNDP